MKKPKLFAYSLGEKIQENYCLVTLSISGSGLERCCAEISGKGEFRLKPGPNLAFPPESFVGKHVTIVGTVLDVGPDMNDWDAACMRRQTGLIEVEEWLGHDAYPAEQLLHDAKRITEPEPWVTLQPFEQAPVVKNKFSQAELEEAYSQMQYERGEDADRANRMYNWVCEQAGINPASGFVGFNMIRVVSPFPDYPDFVFVHQTYGPHLNQFVDLLKKQSWAKHVYGTSNGPVFEVQTPEGTYRVRFDYFDNHFSGY